MKHGMDEVMGLGKVVGHERGVALVHGKHGDSVPYGLLLCRRNCYMGEATKSRRHKSTAQLRQRSTEQRPGRAPASTAMADRREDNAPHYLTVGWKLAGVTPIAG